jgi:thiamine-monophosphate kinase
MSKKTNLTLKDIGERTFLSQISNLIDTPVLSFNEDASTFPLSTEDILVINADMLVNKTDVLPGMKPEQIGMKAVTMSVSDLIAKNSKPLGCLASIGFPSDLLVSEAKEIIRGIKDQCNKYGILYLGGDLNEADDIVIDIVSFGICKKEEILPRKGAKNGDLIFSTGLFGLTSLGFRKLLHNKQVPDELNEKILSATLEPEAKIEYLDLFKEVQIGICMDSSDGLLVTLKEISDANNMGVDVTKAPIPSTVASFANDEDLNPLDLAFKGGEEFELIFSVDPKQEQELLKQAKERNLFIQKIGSFNSDHHNIIILDKDYSEYSLSNEGFEHFK